MSQCAIGYDVMAVAFVNRRDDYSGIGLIEITRFPCSHLKMNRSNE